MMLGHTGRTNQKLLLKDGREVTLVSPLRVNGEYTVRTNAGYVERVLETCIARSLS